MLDDPQVIHSHLKTTFCGIKHPVSNSNHQLEQFRGIKYASIPNRFRRSKLLTDYPPLVDATKYGPIAPQVKVRNVDQSLYGLHPGQYPIEQFDQSEFECLNLNITAPAYLSPHSKLPVMVWVHGGGNVGGNGSRWLLDGGHLVRRSMETGKPMLFVAINYRLGLFGFAASQEIKADNTQAGDKGVGNYGLHDQLNALRWIRNNIAPFGGDPSKITVCGQGKGAVDVHALLLAALGHESQLVYRAILQSGTCPPPSTYPTAGQQGVELMRVCNTLNIPINEEALEKLRSIPADELVKAATKSNVRISPTNDGVFFRPSVDFYNPIPPSPSLGYNVGPVGGMDPPDHLGLGIDAILLGDTYTEATPYMPSAKLWTPQTLTRRIRALLRSPFKADALLRAFEVGDDNDNEEDRWACSQEYAERVGELLADCLVGYGIERLANRLSTDKALAVRRARSTHTDSNAYVPPRSTKVYRYLFDQPSPFNSTAHHTVDLVYLFGNIDFEKTCSEPYSIANTPSAGSDDGDAAEEGSGSRGFGFGFDNPGSNSVDIKEPLSPVLESEASEDATMVEDDETHLTVGSHSPTYPIPPNPINNDWNEHSGYQTMPHLYVWNSSNDGWYEEKRVLEGMQKKWIEFCNGEEPWGEYWPILPKGWGEPEPEPEQEAAGSILPTPDPSPRFTSKTLANHGEQSEIGLKLNPKALRAIEIIEQSIEESGIRADDGMLRAPTPSSSNGVKASIRDEHGKENRDSNHTHIHHIPHNPVQLHHTHSEEKVPSPSPRTPVSTTNSATGSPMSRHSSLSTRSQASYALKKQAIEILQGKVYIFGPAGDTYAAPVSHLAQHRRVDQWREAFEDSPLSLKSSPLSPSSPFAQAQTREYFNTGTGFKFGGGGVTEDRLEELVEEELEMESPGFRLGSSALEEKEIVRIGMELSNGPAGRGRR